MKRKHPTFMETVKRIVRLALDAPLKRAYMDDMGCYKAMAGNWCNSHGAILYSAKEYKNMTLKELKSR